MSTRASCASNPDTCLDMIWNRLDKRFGSAELLESTLKARLSNIPDLNIRKNLYELHDLLCEIQAVKTIDKYSVIFAYLDSSLGIKPIVQKLPRYIQEKWITRVVNYKKQLNVLFPPFSEFVNFIGEMSVIRNDPGLIYDMPKDLPRKTPHRNRPVVSTNKTDTASAIVKDTKRTCIMHKGSKHSINECRAFRGQSLENRKTLLRNHNICLRCCETSDHFANRCQSKVQCDICKSTYHCTALHNDVNYTVLTGSTIVLPCLASGLPPPNITWFDVSSKKNRLYTLIIFYSYINYCVQWNLIVCTQTNKQIRTHNYT